MFSSYRLNLDQQAAFDTVKKGKNIFLSGPAGSGKSTLIQAITEWARSKRITFDVTAMTGCAALLLGVKAKTLHSWAGIGLGRDPVEKLVTSIKNSSYALKRWTRIQMLIIDEISMMTPELFDKLDAIGKTIRKSSKPWGGIQLVLCGDFFQLPPVQKGGKEQVGRFAFDSPSWISADLTPVLLNRIERQTDPAFQTLLNEARIGQLSEDSIALLKSRKGLKWKELKIRPTLLFSRNADVDAINDANLAALKKPIRVFEAKTVTGKSAEDPSASVPTGEVLDRLVTRMDADCSYSPRLELCEGCQVMLVHNKDAEKGLVNGSRGVVIGFRSSDGVPVVQFLHGDPIAIEDHTWESNDSPCLKREQIPLRVAYAVTIHKSQGATLDCALVDIGSSTFECGQAYVALSRVRDLESLYVWNFNPARVMADPRVVAFYKRMESEVEKLMNPPPAPPSTPVLDMNSLSVSVSRPPFCEPAPVSPKKLPLPAYMSNIHSSWHPMMHEWMTEDGGADVLAAVSAAREMKKIYPVESDMFACLQTPLSEVRVILLAQDPYHGPGQAMGLAFSVPSGVKLPPSLKNIRKEFLSDGGTEEQWPADVGDLTPWAKQGVLLLNTTLTVEDGTPTSHYGIGWSSLTEKIMRTVLNHNPQVVFLAWGKHAQTTLKHLPLVKGKTNVFESAHPSPLSANHGFFGSAPFSKVNNVLQTSINWSLVSLKP